MKRYHDQPKSLYSSVAFLSPDLFMIGFRLHRSQPIGSTSSNTSRLKIARCPHRFRAECICRTEGHLNLATFLCITMPDHGFEPRGRERVIAEIRDAARQYGFFQVRGHGVSLSLQWDLLEIGNLRLIGLNPPTEFSPSR